MRQKSGRTIAKRAIEPGHLDRQSISGTALHGGPSALTHACRCRKSSGFTLTELMVTVLIIAILAAIALPSYWSMVQKTRRADAKNALLSDVQALERCYSQYFYYQTPAVPATAAQPACPSLPSLSSNGYYSISARFTTTSPQGYVLTAVASPGSPQTGDSQCASFSIDNLGNQVAYTASAADNSALCWSGRS